MSKRSTGYQLTRYEHEAEGGPSNEEDQAQVASADVLSRRKMIARPKGRIAAGGTSSGATATPANPFAFASATPSPTPSNDRARLIGLNKKFAQTIKQYSESDPAGNWSAAVAKYLDYVKTLDLSFLSNASTPAQPQQPQQPQKPQAAPAKPEAPANPFAGFAKKQDEPKKPEFKPPTNFTFGKPAAEPSSGAPIKFEAPKAFSFGGIAPKKEEKKDDPPAPAKPLFSFGATPAAATGNDDKPMAEDTTEAPKFTFGASKPEASTDAAAPAPKFTFGQASSSASTPAFTFGKSDTSNDTGSKFTFAAKPTSGDNSTPKFTFGANSNPNSDGVSKPFTFGASASASASAGAGSDENAATPKFSFGNSNGNGNAPKFSFGQPSDPAKFNVNSTWKPSAKPEESKESGDANDGDEDDDAAPAEPQQDLTGKGAGEENEDSVFEVRTKLYDSKNESAGLGVLRVLVHRESKKSRVVVRADGSGRVLINSVVPAAVTYAATKNFVTIPTFGADKPVPYRARVKTEQSATELADKLNEVKA